MIVHQAFFGMSDNGYRILAVSDPKQKSEIESICGLSVVKTDCLEKDVIFSIRRKETVFMCCLMKGSHLDRNGRKTILLHIFFANAEAASSMGINAFTLQENGFFRRDVPPDVSAIEIGSPWAWDESMTLLLPQKADRHCLIPCSNPVILVAQSPAEDPIRKLVGKQVNDISWSTYSTKFVDCFNCFAIPEDSKNAVTTALLQNNRVNFLHRCIPVFCAILILGGLMGGGVGFFLANFKARENVLADQKKDFLTQNTTFAWRDLPQTPKSWENNEDVPENSIFLKKVRGYVDFMNKNIIKLQENEQ